MSSNYRGNGPPPQPNPVLSGYESFVENTPLVTRYVITTLCLSWLLSWFVDPSLAVANIPLFTVLHFELYRIVFSPLVCGNLLTLIFAFMSFGDSGKRLEFSLGSTAFAWLLFTVGCVTNIAFLLFCFVFYFLTSSQVFLVMNCQGISTVLLGIIAIECANAPPGTQRRLFFLTVPTIYFPLAILVLFSLLAGFNISYLISVGVGYAYAYGYLNRIKVSNATFNRWEEGCLNNFTQRKGWVVGQAATGAAAWIPVNAPEGGDQSSSWTPSSFFRGRPTDSAESPQGGNATVASPPDGGWAAPGKAAKPSFPSSSGRALGSTGGSSSADARAARLAALERRNVPDSESKEENV